MCWPIFFFFFFVEQDEGRAHVTLQNIKTKNDKKVGVNDYGKRHFFYRCHEMKITIDNIIIIYENIMLTVIFYFLVMRNVYFWTTGIKHRNSKALKLYNIERKFQVISHLSGNVECLGFILNGLNNYIVNILQYLEANYDLSLRHICTLLKTILNVSYLRWNIIRIYFFCSILF